ncbi:MAG: endolytic transglycosylase MltG [Propionibacteriaceae bacterium]|jgi:UPF0755 protein|nr:endolytic transglycosylase MltG [Propionibacteriaceae bacterium]
MATRFTRNLRDPGTGKFSGREIWLRVRAMLAVVVSVGVLGAGGYYAYDWASVKWSEFKTAEDYEGDGAGQPEVEITIPEGATLSAIGKLLVENDVIKTTKAFTEEVNRNEDSKNVQAGRYLLPTKISALVALNMLLDPTNQLHERVTLREGLWLTDYATTLAKATELPKKDFTAAFKNVKKIGLPPWASKAKTAEGFIFPDTYDVPDKPKAIDMVKMTTKRFGAIAKELDIEARAKALKVTPYQIVIIASIIEREVNREEDRPKVARVIYNRLKQGIKLGMDSTVSYAVGKQGVIGLDDKDLASDSPYNTRKFKGLPPGPIGNPGKLALEAAMNPTKGDWLYFVAVNPAAGQTEFSVKYDDFLKSKAKYEKWCASSDENFKLCYGRDR